MRVYEKEGGRSLFSRNPINFINLIKPLFSHAHNSISHNYETQH